MNQAENETPAEQHAFLSRNESLARLRSRDRPWDMIVIGGGATGVGVALDAAARGLDVLLAERFDWGKGTSSRSTKLVHGGVRYLQQGNLTLVRDALRERSLLQRNAPHLVHALPFVIPCEGFFSRFYYWFGLKLYDLLGRGDQFKGSRALSADQVQERLPTLADHGAGGGVIYQDGQFDDARLLIDMAVTAAGQGACLINAMSATRLTKTDAGTVEGVELTDQLTGETLIAQGRAVINATGPFCDELRLSDDAAAERLVAASQGVHLTLPKRFLPGDTALMVPKTSDGRVLFLIPWHDHVVVGTTDTAIPEAVVEPVPQEAELRFLLQTASEYLTEKPTAKDVLSVFTGIRPLVKNDPSARTASLSRDHKIEVSPSGLLTITGGKWTTVRKMAEDVVDRALRLTSLGDRPCRTADMKIVSSPPVGDPSDEKLHPDLPYRREDVLRATRYEMANTVEDVLARRTRALFLNAKAAIGMAPDVAVIMASELGHDDAWCQRQVAEFQDVAKPYVMPALTDS